MRQTKNWLKAFVSYCSHGEAPPRMYFWTGVSTLSGALRRHVWFPGGKHFTWYPSLYIILVGPPGVVAKSTTVNLGMNLLREIPGIHFGPDIVTPQALVSAFSDASEAFLFPPTGEYIPQSAITLAASELGNLLNTRDDAMVNLLIELFDGNPKLDKRTKTSGNDLIEAPWLNFIGCTTPGWMAGNFTEQMISGGLISRILFVYADKKEKLVPYPHLVVPTSLPAQHSALVSDLGHISTLVGEFSLSPAAAKWGMDWYARHWSAKPAGLEDESRFGGYLARKQTHLHKVAMILSIAERDSLQIESDDLQLAEIMLADLESDLPRVFQQVGKSETSVQLDRFLDYCRKRGKVPFRDAYRFIHAQFPDFQGFQNLILGCVNSGQIKIFGEGLNAVIHFVEMGEKKPGGVLPA